MSVPLDLEIEYNNLAHSLESIGKQFKIQREAFSNDKLTDIIDSINSQQSAMEVFGDKDHSPILHISSHGAFDGIRKQYYLAIEGTMGRGEKIG